MSETKFTPERHRRRSEGASMTAEELRDRAEEINDLELGSGATVNLLDDLIDEAADALEAAEKRAKEAERLITQREAEITRVLQSHMNLGEECHKLRKRAEKAEALRGNFLWSCDIDSDDLDEQIKAHGYEVINGRTEEYVKAHWDALLEAVIKKRLEGAREAWAIVRLSQPEHEKRLLAFIRAVFHFCESEAQAWDYWMFHLGQYESGTTFDDFVKEQKADGHRAVRVLIIPAEEVPK